MDPLSISSLNALVQTLLARQEGPGLDLEALFKAAGPEMLLRFLEQGPEGAKLELPGGKVIIATGELPFPEGTILKVLLEREGDVFKLNTVEATPPGKPPLLAPLAESEAAVLLNRLSVLIKEDSNETSLTPSGKTLSQAAFKLAESSAPSMKANEDVKALAGLLKMLRPALSTASKEPVPGFLNRGLMAVKELPESARKSLLGLLSLPAAAEPAEVMGTLERFLAAVHPEQGGEATNESRVPLSPLSTLLARFQSMTQTAKMAPEEKTLLDGWFKNLIQGLENEKSAQTKSSEGKSPASVLPAKTQSPQADAKAERQPPNSKSHLPQGIAEAAAKLEKILATHPGHPAELPEAWENWIRGSARVLSDPASSPMEAPFHIAQSKESTGFFEIPLPWAGSGPLQLWVEEDAGQEFGGDTEAVKRVLLSLRFTQLGETRIGLQSAGGALSVRIWAEHPELLSNSEVERELGEISNKVSLSILPLRPDASDIRSLVCGEKWMGLA